MKLDRNKVNAVMAEKLFSVKRLAEESGASERTVSTAIKGNNCTHITAGKIAKALGVKTIEIM